jgi:hypothetical protein
MTTLRVQPLTPFAFVLELAPYELREPTGRRALPTRRR